MASDATPTADLPLPCPHCGYDLRGNVGGVCPECGRGFDVATLVAAAALPWNDRRWVGAVRAFGRQAAQAIRRPRKLAELVGRPVDYRSARRFQAVCALVGGVGLAVPLTLGFLAVRPGLLDPAAGLGGFGPPTVGPAWVDYLLDGLLLLALLLGGFLWLLTITGVAGYFLHPRDAPLVRQNSAVALLYFLSGPLVLLPAVLLLACLGEVGRHLWPTGRIPLGTALIAGGGYGGAAALLLLIVGRLWWGPTLLLTRGLCRGKGRVVAMTLTLLLAWPVLFAACVLLPPLLTWWAECVVLTLLA